MRVDRGDLFGLVGFAGLEIGLAWQFSPAWACIVGGALLLAGYVWREVGA